MSYRIVRQCMILLVNLLLLSPLAGESWPQSNSQRTRKPEVRIVSAVGMRQVLLKAAPLFERKANVRLTLTFGSAGDIVRDLNQGLSADVVFLPEAAIESLRDTDILDLRSKTPIASSIIGVAIRNGQPIPDISTVESFKLTLINARLIACPDPQRAGSSGTYLKGLFERLGIADTIKTKLVFASRPDVPTEMPGYLVARRKADIALHQMQELKAVPGLRIVGPLPEPLQTKFTFSALLSVKASESRTAISFVKFLRTARSRSIIQRTGMEPAF